MVAAGPWACALVVVTTGVDVTTGVGMEATEGGLGFGVVFTSGALGLLAVSTTGQVWVVGPCVDSNARGVVGGAELAVEWLGVCVEGLCVSVGLLAFAVGVAAS